MTRPAALLFLASIALYAGTFDRFFVSDDFLNLERNGFRTLGEAVGFFSTAHVDFYRPIPRLHFGLFQGLFADRVVVWNLAGALLHGLVSAAVVFLAGSLLGERNRRAARWAGLFFVVHFIHVEPVVWASGVTSLYVTFFIVVALVFFRRAREHGLLRDRILAVVAYFLALLSKETAVAFIPLLIFTTWWWPGADRSGRSQPRRLSIAEAAPFAVLTIAYLLVISGIDRGGAESPYRMTVGPHLLKNAAFYLLGGFVPVRYWQVQDLWTATTTATDGGGLFAFAVQVLRRPSLGPPLVLGAAALAAAAVRGGRDIRGGFVWILLAALPFLPLPGSGERFHYLPSVGASLVLGLGAQHLLRSGRRLPGGVATARAIAGLALALLVAGNLDRQSDWATAGRWTRGICDRWSYFRSLEPDRPIEFVGIPDDYRSAWVFRNGLDSMARLYWEGRLYRREGEMPPGAPAGLRMQVTFSPTGTVGMMPLTASAGPSPSGPPPTGP